MTHPSYLEGQPHYRPVSVAYEALFECPVCGAVVVDPAFHAPTHDGERLMRDTPERFPRR